MNGSMAVKFNSIFKGIVSPGKNFIYRAVSTAAVIVMIAITLAVPVKMFGHSPWANYYGVINFSQGQLVVDETTHEAQVAEAKDLGGTLAQYVEIDDGVWALEKAPGYIFYMVPFELLGIPRWGNILLALGMFLVTYLLLKRLRDEKTACIGSLLLLFATAGLIMLNSCYMDSYAALAFLAIGGGLYLLYLLEKANWSVLKSSIVLLIAFSLMSWSVVTRYTNFPVAAVFALHFLITWIITLKKERRIKLSVELISAAAGIIIPAAVLLLYDYAVFGSPFDYGYHYTSNPINFAFQYLGQVDENGQSVPWQIIVDNFKTSPMALLEGFPLLVIGIPAFAAVLYAKIACMKNPELKNGFIAGINRDISWGIFWIMTGWFVFVFGLYMTYEFTADLSNETAFIRIARFYLPGLFPVAFVSAIVLGRIPAKVVFPLVAVIIVAGSILYWQYVTSAEGHGQRSGTQDEQRPSRSDTRTRNSTKTTLEIPSAGSE